MKHLYSILFACVVIFSPTYSYAQRIYGNPAVDDYIITNTDYFCIPNTPENQGLTTSQKDFYSTMRYAQVMGEVSKDGVTKIIGNVEISSEKFTQGFPIVNWYLENLKMIILKPLKATTAKRPCVLISIGGANANLSEFPFLTTATQYLMKGYVVAYFENPNINTTQELLYLNWKMNIDVNNQPSGAGTK